MMTKLKLSDAKKIVVYILAMYYLYPFSLETSIKLIINIIYVALPILYFLIKYKSFLRLFRQNRKNSWLNLSLLVLFVSFLYALFVYITSGDFSFIQESYIQLIWRFLRFLFIYLIVVDVFGKDKSFYNYIKTLSIATAIYVVVSLIMIVNPGFRNYWLSLVQPDLQLLYVWQDFGRIGLMGRTNADTSMFISLIFLGVCLSNKIYKKIDAVYLVSAILMLVGNILYGRLGLFLSVMIFFVFYGSNLFRKVKKKAIRWAVFLCALFVLVGLIYSNLVDGDIFNQIVGLSIEPIVSLFSSSKSGSISLGHSADELGTMYFWMGLKTFLIGDGVYQTETGKRYMMTDPAFMRKILYGGVFQILLMYISAMLLVKSFCYKLKRIDIKSFRRAVFLFIIILFLAEAKDTIFSNWYIMCLMFIIALTNDYAELFKKDVYGEKIRTLL